MKPSNKVKVKSKEWNTWRDALDGEENLEGIKPNIEYTIDEIIYDHGEAHLIHLESDPEKIFRRPYWFEVIK